MKWRDIGPLTVGTISGNKMVVFDYSPNYTEHVSSRRLAKNMTGFEGALHDTFGMSAEELAGVMNEWRDAQLDNKSYQHFLDATNI